MLARPALMIFGAGMAGLAAAARARELGASPVVFEKGSRPGGSMLLSSCVVWRYRSLELFREQCPRGDPELQRVVVEGLDQALEWLERLRAPVVSRATGNPLTVGVRFDPRGLTETLVRVAGDVRLRESGPGPSPEKCRGRPRARCAAEGGLGPPRGSRTPRSTPRQRRGLAGEPGVPPRILATGGFQGDAGLVAEHIRPAAPLALRANPWSSGDGLRYGLERGAALSAGMDEFYGRNMPDVEVDETDYVRAAQLYARTALVVNLRGEEFLRGPVSWSETDAVQQTARQHGALAWYVLREEALTHPVRERTVRELVDTAAALGGTVVPARELPFAVPDDAVIAVRVRASITNTIGGLRIDSRARVLGEQGEPLDGLYAAGADAGGIAAGGYASGLAAALVFGRIAAETALS